MGLFDKVLGSGSDSLTPPEGFCGIALAAVAADGVIEPEEVHSLENALLRMKLFREMGDRQIRSSFDKVVKLARNKGVETLVQKSAEAIPKELRATAFALAADLLFADGEVSSEERKFLEKIQVTLGVPDSDALKIVEVMAIKNKA